MESVIFPILAFSAMAAVALSWWALGQWLRRKGYGDRLDRIAHELDAVQHRAGRLARPASLALIGAGSGLTRLPFLGSRGGRAMWDDMRHLPPPASRRRQ